MAQIPTSGWGMRDLLMPAILNIAAAHNIEMHIWWAPEGDSIILAAAGKNGSRYKGFLLTNLEIQNDLWRDLVPDRIMVAVNAVTSQPSDAFAAEYEEIMQAQDLMNEIKP